MRRVLERLFFLFPAVLMPVLYFPYDYMNRNYIVQRFGCGCPKFGQDGTIITNNFNANDFTRWFWMGAAVLSVVLSIFASKPLSKWYFRIVYVMTITTYCALLTTTYIQNMMWQ